MASSGSWNSDSGSEMSYEENIQENIRANTAKPRPLKPWLLKPSVSSRFCMIHLNGVKTKHVDELYLFKAAAAGDHKKVLELSSQVSIDINKKQYDNLKNSMTPLQIAAANGHETCVQILIEHGADINAKDSFDTTALHMAAEQGHYLCLKALLKRRADCNVPMKTLKIGFRIVTGGQTPLHLAAANNHVECVEELINYGADYNATDQNNRTSLYLAAEGGFSECVLVHLRSALGKQILSIPSLDTSNTPLHFAVSQGKLECVKELLYLNPDVNHLNRQGRSPLHLAVSPLVRMGSDYFEILKLLILFGRDIDINKPDARDQTPLHYTRFTFRSFDSPWSKDMAKFLIAYGANVNIKNRQGYSLLEQELNSPDNNCEVLEYVVRSMSTLPRLESLNVYQIHERRLDLTSLTYTTHIPISRPLHYEMMPHQQLRVEVDTGLNDGRQANVKTEKHVWYEKLTSNPRSLKHHCRYVIRRSMGAKNLKYIDKLSIPAKLKSYLLLENDARWAADKEDIFPLINVE